ncbi:hypothetical protein [Adhaeribacter soli]|uniref:Glycosyltransferase RgtA/B/C/D-like domain-containing protein n=1 Tax=Adhaeribacter soli TaxID=2607655 RepID=A0A5N1J5Z1_9BACT|nr:hypothetical protein [Adhaeribacter soli]KAA9340597.1 hypothetical protein F0P94_03980 [Adhaeribacter soli]
MLFSAILSLSIFSGLVFLFWKLAARDLSFRHLFWPALAFKILCGIIIGLAYQGKYDTFLYQKAAESLTAFGFNDFTGYLNLIFFSKLPEPGIIQLGKIKTYSNSFFFIKPLSLLNFITGSNYFLNSLFFTLFCFAGCWYFVRTVHKFFPGSTFPAVLAFLFFPSVVFWTSGILKESVLLGSLCFFWGAALNLLYGHGNRKHFWLLLLLFSGYILWKIKFFLAALVFCLTAAWFVLRWLQQKFPFFRKPSRLGLILPVVLLPLAAFIQQWSESFDIQFFFRRLVSNYNTLQKLSTGRPVIRLENFEPTFFSALANVPEAVLSVFYRPFFWEGNNLLYRLAGIENLVLLVLSLGIFSVFYKGRPKQIPGFYFVLLVYIFIMATIFGLSTPNLGSLNRYRSAILPFFIFLLLQLPVWKNMLIRFNRLFFRQAANVANRMRKP